MNKATKRKQRSKSILMLLVYLITLVLVLTYTFVTVFLQYVHLPTKPEKPIPPIELPNIDEPGGLLDDGYYEYDDGSGETLLYQHILEYLNDKNSHHNDFGRSFLLYEANIYATWIISGDSLENEVKNHGYDYSTTMDRPSSNGIFYKTVFYIDSKLDIPKDTKEINDCIIIAKNGIWIQDDLSINKSLVLTKDLNTYDDNIKLEMNKDWIYSGYPYFGGDILDYLEVDNSIVGILDKYPTIHDGEKIEPVKVHNSFSNSYVDIV